MFSRKIVFLIGAILIIATNITILTASTREVLPKSGIERLTITLIAPFQLVFSKTMGFTVDLWKDYFATVNAGKENGRLRRELASFMEIRNRCSELTLENERLRKFIDFQESEQKYLIAAKVIGRDPSPWFKTIMIDKGVQDGLSKGLAVMVSEGVVGQIVAVSEHFSRVLLVTDRNSSVDALVQNSRARGIVKGNNTEHCLFKYALRKEKILSGEMIVSSGLDGVFSKGLRIGRVVDVTKDNSDLFQTVVIKTFVDFDKLEEVLVAKKAVDPDVEKESSPDKDS